MPGTGIVSVNKREFLNYFPRETDRIMILTPLKLTNTEAKFDVDAKVAGGGSTGQAGAIKLGISRALLTCDLGNRPVLKGGLLRPGVPEKRKRNQDRRGRVRNSSGLSVNFSSLLFLNSQSLSPSKSVDEIGFFFYYNSINFQIFIDDKGVLKHMIRVGIIGVSGYSGKAVLDLLLRHPDVRVTYVAANNTTGALEDIWPNLRHRTELVCEKFDVQKAAQMCDSS